MTPFPLAASSLATLAAVLLEDSVGAPTKRGVTALHPLSQAREGDDLMAFSSFLRERYGLLFDDEEAEAAEQLYRKARLCKEALDKNGTIHRFFHSHGYRKVAEKALKGIWTASVKTRLMLMSEDGAVPHGTVACHVCASNTLRRRSRCFRQCPRCRRRSENHRKRRW
ncbi:hypothetical protein FA95DRAFT_710297 [Auriscalpium vulgare]|uniref:Uncharacterized protein n=1 Tax=Auriscalpium vulgare TaxID=40419 RepID=A0ACB8RB02_9AGAM|nr:hypothetical protein FA95DRAFT_710297 [Auriscalpium vulgare]